MTVTCPNNKLEFKGILEPCFNKEDVKCELYQHVLCWYVGMLLNSYGVIIQWKFYGSSDCMVQFLFSILQNEICDLVCFGE